MSLTSARIVRYTIALLFLWFGAKQLVTPEMFLAFLPEWTGYVPVPAEMIVRLNGWTEVIGAIMLICGIWTRPAAALLGFHLFCISLSMTGPTMIRDLALASITLSLVFSTPDAWTMDAKYSQKSIMPNKT